MSRGYKIRATKIQGLNQASASDTDFLRKDGYWSPVAAAGSVGQSNADSINTPTLSVWEAKLQNYLANNGRARVLVMSDSTGAGGVNPDVGWPYQLANALCNSGIKAGHECIFGGLFSVSTTVLTIGSSFSRDTTIGTVGGDTYKASTTTNALAFQPQTPISHARIYYIQQPGGGVFSVEVAGVGLITQDTNGTLALAYVDWTSGGTVFSGSPANVKYVSGGQVNIAGFECWNNNCVTVINTSLGGSAVGDWSANATATDWLNGVLTIAPDLVIMAPGINSMPGTSLATYQTQITTVVNALQAAGIDIIMLTPVPQNPTDGTHNNSVATQDGYVAVNVAMAAQFSIPLVHVYQYFGSYAKSSVAPYTRYVDTWTHPNLAGYSAIRAMVYDLMTVQTPAHPGINQTVNFESVDAAQNYKISGNTNLSRAGTGSVIVGTTTATGTAATNCVVVGDGAGALLSTAQNSTIVGNGALAASQSGKINNCIFGYQAAKVAVSSNNCVFGLQAGLIMTSGSDNLIIGYKVGSTVLTTGARNVLLGTSNAVTTPAAGTNDYVNIQNSIRGYSVPPTVASGFGTSPAVAGGSTFAFTLTVGTGGSASSGTFTMPQSPTGWIMNAQDLTTPGVNVTKMTAQTATSVTLTNYNSTTGAAAAWAAGDVLYCTAVAY